MIFNISGYINPNIKLAHSNCCVIHSLASTYYSAKYLMNLDDYSYYMFTIISSSYFINDILYHIWYYNKQSLMYITHHGVTLIVLSRYCSINLILYLIISNSFVIFAITYFLICECCFYSSILLSLYNSKRKVCTEIVSTLI